jgi:hypothetical protein
MQPTAHIHAVLRIWFGRVKDAKDEYIARMAKLKAGDFWIYAAVVFACGAAMGVAQAPGKSIEPSTPAVDTQCSGLVATMLDGAKVTSAVVVPAATAVADAPLGPYTLRVMPAFCRVKVTDRPSADSEIKTEVWLPLAGWDGRYRGFGNGGFAGTLAYEQMAAAVKEGAVASATDAGHVGYLPEFALGHPEKVKDFGWRAVHDMTVQAKAIAASFYGSAVKHAYFEACSDGGREALMEAERFPADYDGILAGAPAYNWSGLLSAGAKNAQRLQSSAAAYVDPKKLPALGAAVRAACDAKDGVTDGVLNDPRQCSFDPASMACSGAETDSCLMPEQVKSVKELYTTKLDATGKKVFPGYLPGAEDAAGSWSPWLIGQKNLLLFFGGGYFADFVHEQAGWTVNSFDFDADYKLATEKTGAALNSTDTNIKAFAARGGKLILYHGWNDPAIPALSTVDYYDGMGKTMGKDSVDRTVRLYMVPGMLHCGGGPGATNFGEEGGARGDAKHDVLTALEDWVEEGKRPGDLIAVKFADDDPTKAVVMSRPVCVYPKAAKYVAGDTTDAKSFVCAEATSK